MKNNYAKIQQNYALTKIQLHKKLFWAKLSRKIMQKLSMCLKTLYCVICVVTVTPAYAIQSLIPSQTGSCKNSKSFKAQPTITNVTLIWSGFWGYSEVDKKCNNRAKGCNSTGRAESESVSLKRFVIVDFRSGEILITSFGEMSKKICCSKWFIFNRELEGCTIWFLGCLHFNPSF